MSIGLAQVLSQFSLSHSEIVDRRKLLLERKGADEVTLFSQNIITTCNTSGTPSALHKE